jgi:transposase
VLTPNLQAKEVIIGEGVRQRRYIVCYNPKEAERERRHREQVVKDLKRLLSQHKDQSSTAQWAVTLKASGRYGRYLKITENNQLCIHQEAIRQAIQYDGKWVIQTNDDTLTLEDAACGYKALLVIERCFRSLKQTQIKMTPMFHWLPHRIETHVKICVLALLIERIAEHTCQQPWSRIRDHLNASSHPIPHRGFLLFSEKSAFQRGIGYF